MHVLLQLTSTNFLPGRKTRRRVWSVTLFNLCRGRGCDKMMQLKERPSKCEQKWCGKHNGNLFHVFSDKWQINHTLIHTYTVTKSVSITLFLHFAFICNSFSTGKRKNCISTQVFKAQIENAHKTGGHLMFLGKQKRLSITSSTLVDGTSEKRREGAIQIPSGWIQFGWIRG